MTSKGQITLPASFRKELGLQSGKKIAVSLNNGSITIKPPSSLDEVRALMHEEMKAKGTLDIPVSSGDGWTAHVKEKYGS